MTNRNIIFVTGTDTGVGKTVLAALLLRHFRSRGINALPMKPYCAGTRADARLLKSACQEPLTVDEVNPFYFPQPVAPFAAVSNTRVLPSASKVIAGVRQLARRSDLVVVEGIGGLFVPLHRRLFVIDIIAKLRPKTIVVAPNRLGVINHALLSWNALKQVTDQVSLVLVDQKTPDVSARSNAMVLRRLLPQTAIFSLPFFVRNPLNTSNLALNEIKIKKTLARLASGTYFPRRSLESKEDGSRKKIQKRFGNRLTLNSKSIQ